MSTQANIDILKNLEMIRKRFVEVENIYVEGKNEIDTLRSEKFKDDFLSIAFESWSKCLAKNCLTNGEFDPWYQFLTRYPEFNKQIQIGFGLAMGENSSGIDVLNDLKNSIDEQLMINGLGYYNALFRRLITLENKEELKSGNLERQMAYDTGIGRALYYIHKGNLSLIEQKIDAFDDPRKEALWKGIGTAAAFIGGMNKAEIENLVKVSSVFSGSLIDGLHSAVASRSKSGLTTSTTQLIVDRY